MDPKELIETGLTKQQANAYLELLQHPQQTGGSLAKKLSIDRSFAYSVLNALAEKGLASHVTMGGLKLFQATHPRNLLRDVEEKQSRINKIVKELELIKSQPTPEPDVAVYAGKSGIKAFLVDLLEEKSFVTLGGGGTLKILDVLKYEYPHYFKKFRDKKIKGRLITSSQNKKTMGTFYRQTGGTIRTFDGLQSDVSFTIFKDKLAIYSAEEKPFTIVIQNKRISDALKQYFEKLWKCAK